MIRNPDTLSQWPRGPVDKASAQGAGQCRFESYCFALASTQVGYFCIRNPATRAQWPRGPMDKASAYGAGDCRFESYRGHHPAEGRGASQTEELSRLALPAAAATVVHTAC